MLSHHDRLIILATLRALAEKDVHLNYGTEDGYEACNLPALARAFEEGRADLLASAIEKQVEGAPLYKVAAGLHRQAALCGPYPAAKAYAHAAELVEAALNGGE